MVTNQTQVMIKYNMLRFVGRTVPVLAVIMMVSVVGFRVASAAVQASQKQPVAAYADPSCLSFCWNGLEARLTPSTMALDVIEEYDILYRDRRSQGAVALTFQVDDNTVGMAWMGMELERLQFNFEACPLDLILLLGTPDRVRREDASDDMWLYYQAGASLRLAPQAEPDTFHTLYFWDRSQVYRYVNGTEDRNAINWPQALRSLRTICR